MKPIASVIKIVVGLGYLLVQNYVENAPIAAEKMNTELIKPS